MGLVLIFLFIFSITFVIIAIPTLIIINNRIKRCTQSVPGVFVRDNVHRMGRNTYFMPVISYTLDGVEYELEATYAEGLGGIKTQPAGTPLTVYYDPAQPTYVWASRNGSFGQRTAMKVLLWVGIAGLIICGVWFLFLLFSR